MILTHPQLAAIVARALPADSLREAKQAGADRYALRLAGGETLHALLYTSERAATTAAAALRTLKDEFDLPVPALRAADITGETVGIPYLLVSGAEGEPLTELRPRIPEAQLYAIGQQLGEAATRIHRLARPQFGPLEGEGAINEQAYLLARVERGLTAAAANGMLNNATAAELRNWFAQVQPVIAQPALIHGGLSAETLLVRRVGATWRLGCIIGWEQAVGWVPAWEHTTFRENTDVQLDFPLRVGYGNAYDERTQRAYEQVREPVMQPYRALILLEALGTHTTDLQQASDARTKLLALVRSLVELGRTIDSD